MSDENAVIREYTLNAESAIKTIEMKTDDKRNLIKISDDGLGMTKADLNRFILNLDSYRHSYPPSLNILG